jgi:hypothetical protein
MSGYPSPAARIRTSAALSAWPDRLAIGASGACLVHCLALPLLIAGFPAASQFLALPEAFHLLAVAAAVPVSAWAMIRGYRHHGLLLPASLGFLGLVLLGAGALSGAEEMLETGLSVAGSLVLAFAHLRNWQLRGPGRVPPPAA